MLTINRRQLLQLAAASGVGGEGFKVDQHYKTPYKYGKLVLRGSGVGGDFDERSVDCPFVFWHQKRFYMTYVGFDGTGYQTGLASSENLIDWNKQGCILRRDKGSPITRYNSAMNWILRENELQSPGRLKKLGGRFLGVYHAYPNAGLEEGPAVIGTCTSNNLQDWHVGEPILFPKDGADWERGGLYKPCLVEERGKFYLFYNAKTDAARGWREQTGVATSTDLKSWKRYEGNPIIPNGEAGSWDERFASDPCVLIRNGTWAFFYYGLAANGKARDLLALGKDPFHPSKVNEISIDVGPPGAVDSTYAHKPSVVYHDNALYHFYCAVSGKYPDEVRGISVARSRTW